MRFRLNMALAVSLMLQAGAPASAATDVDIAAKDTGHATAKATEDVVNGTSEAAKKTSHAAGHAVSKTGHSIEKGASKTADQGEISKLLHAIHRFGAQVGREICSPLKVLMIESRSGCRLGSALNRDRSPRASW
jgi:hypothetical protein